MNNLKKIKCIHVGLGKFSVDRLIINRKDQYFETVAFVDIDRKKALDTLKKIQGLPNDYEKRLFSTISDANLAFKAEACFIYVSADQHADLIIESLNNKLHTLCVKPIACSMEEFKKILATKKRNKNYLLINALNNQWSDASIKMQKMLSDKQKFGEFLMGYCICWGRQNLSSQIPLIDTSKDGIFFHSMGCHQLGQLVMAIGLPKTVTCLSPIQEDVEIGFNKINRTAGGSCILEYENQKVFSYIGTRAGHSNPYGFASRWSGSWMFHGSKGDLIRDGGRISLFQKDKMIEDIYLKDLDLGLIEDDKRQIQAFYNEIRNKGLLQKKSLSIWILMEALNLSSRENKKIIIEEFMKSFDEIALE